MMRAAATTITKTDQVRGCGSSLAILVFGDGLASYVTAFLRVFRTPVRICREGRPRLVLEKGVLLGQVVKQYAQRRIVSVYRRIVRGMPESIAAALAGSSGRTAINKAYIERLNGVCSKLLR